MKARLAPLNKRFYRWGMAGFILLLAAGCAGTQKKYDIVKPMSAGLDTWPEVYRQNFQAMNSFHGNARVTIESQQFSGNVSMEVSWIRPDKLYIQAEGPLGIDVGKIYVGASRFIIYNQYNNHFTSGSVDDPYLNRLWLTNFSLQELKYAVLGYAAQAERPLRLSDEFHGVFTAQDEEIEYRFIVNPERGLLERCEILRDGRVFMQQDFKKYKSVNGFYVPQIIQITMLEQKERLSIFYEDMQINKQLDARAFVIDVNSKVQQLNLN